MSENSFYSHAKPILVAVDCIIFGFHKGQLKLLLFKRKVNPFIHEWSLIGSFVQPSESIQQAAARVLIESTGLLDIFMEPLACYGAINRDPGARVISQAYYSLIRIDTQEKLGVENFQARWFDFEQLPTLILDHHQMIQDALALLRSKARYRPIGFELLPEKFTIPQLRTLYEAIYQRTLDRRNFRKKILSMDILEKLTEKDKTTSKKGAFLYRFKEEKYQIMMKKGINFDL